MSISKAMAYTCPALRKLPGKPWRICDCAGGAKVTAMTMRLHSLRRAGAGSLVRLTQRSCAGQGGCAALPPLIRPLRHGDDRLAVQPVMTRPQPAALAHLLHDRIELGGALDAD